MKIFFYIFIFLLAGCGDGNGNGYVDDDYDYGNDSENDYIYSDHTISVGSYYYNPQELVVELGQSVKWVNSGGVHDVEITSGPISFYLDACSGSCIIGTHTFNQVGTYNYICSIGNHAQQGMIGSIIVVENIDY